MSNGNADPNCGCLGCAIWPAIRQWHRGNDMLDAATGQPVYNVVTVVEAINAVLAELLAHVRMEDPQQAQKFLLKAITELPAEVDRYEALLLAKRGEEVIHSHG